MSRKGRAYAQEVLAVLRAQLPKYDHAADDIVLSTIEKHYDQPVEHLEVIIDSPFSANWRLKSAGKTNRVRVADYRWPQRNDTVEATVNTSIHNIK